LPLMQKAVSASPDISASLLLITAVSMHRWLVLSALTDVLTLTHTHTHTHTLTYMYTHLYKISVRLPTF